MPFADAELLHFPPQRERSITTETLIGFVALTITLMQSARRNLPWREMQTLELATVCGPCRDEKWRKVVEFAGISVD